VITLRKSTDRGHADHGWLLARHSFSFADYFDPEHMGFRSLRVLNEDRIQPGQGFPTHGHRDMEILTYVLEGELRHEDSMGNGSLIRPGDVQTMTAGRGVLHSEFNPSDSTPLHLVQVWIQPDAKGLDPGYDQHHFPESERRSELRLVASADGRDGSLRIHQDANVHVGLLSAGDTRDIELDASRHAWLQVLRGSIDLDGQRLEQGDAAGISEQSGLSLLALEEAEVMLFDLA
jgi:redox-sensitive bicupin YhaK (pirin superfamily)